MLEYETPQILSLGVLNVDFVMELGPERVGKKKMGKQISISAGGHGCSQAIAAVRCGVPAAAIGRVGSDAFGPDGGYVFFPDNSWYDGGRWSAEQREDVLTTRRIGRLMLLGDWFRS